MCSLIFVMNVETCFIILITPWPNTKNFLKIAFWNFRFWVLNDAVGNDICSSRRVSITLLFYYVFEYSTGFIKSKQSSFWTRLCNISELFPPISEIRHIEYLVFKKQNCNERFCMKIFEIWFWRAAFMSVELRYFENLRKIYFK